MNVQIVLIVTALIASGCSISGKLQSPGHGKGKGKVKIKVGHSISEVHAVKKQDLAKQDLVLRSS